MFKDKVAVVTGAGSGIGRALALQLARAGAQLALSDINQVALTETIRQINTAGPADGTPLKVKGYPLDVADKASVFAHAQEVIGDFGTVHVLFNNAGTTLVGTVANTSIEEFEWQLGINMWGVVYVTKAFMPTMLKQREGTIVNISSVFGLLSFACQGAYSMSKFAVRGLTECLWSELEGSGVNAVCVHPGGIKTNIEKAGRRVKLAGSVEELLTANADKMLTTSPERCAADILKGIHRGDRRILTGNNSTTMFWLSRIFPNAYPRLLGLLK
jgi:short-subunit dehydrogenase